MERRGHRTAELCLSDAKKKRCMNITFELRLGKTDLSSSEKSARVKCQSYEILGYEKENWLSYNYKIKYIAFCMSSLFVDYSLVTVGHTECKH